MNQVITTGKNVDEALRLALTRLGASESDIEYEVLEEATKGFLGIGAKECKILVKVKSNPETYVLEFVQSVLKNMGIDAEVKSHVDTDGIKIDIIGEDIGLVIGKHGQTLDSLQYIANLVVHKQFEGFVQVRIDVGGYREKRTEALENLASRLAARVRKSRKAIALEPMNSYERRIVHTFIQNEPGVSTKSEGMDPYRHVVIYAERTGARKKPFKKA